MRDGFWLGLHPYFNSNSFANEKSDHWALANGYVAVTPTTVDVTAYGLMDELKTWF